MTDTLLVNERFLSIQGESTYAGLPCLFIRLSGCNLRCGYCDAAYTWEEPGNIETVSQLMAWAARYPDTLIEITGGEPLLQENVYPLMQGFIDNGRQVLLETNGSVPLSRVPDEVAIIMDIKSPDSGMHLSLDLGNLELLRQRAHRQCPDEVKFVLCSPEDFHWAAGMVRRHKLSDHLPVLFSPVTQRISPKTVAELLLDAQLPVRLQLQLHTLLWPEKQRGA